MEDPVEILRVATTKGLPKRIDEQSEVPVELVRELVEAGLLAAIDISTLDGPAFADARITHAGRKELKGIDVTHGQRPAKTVNVTVPVPILPPEPADQRIKVFISHSSTDEPIARCLVRLLKDATSLRAGDIRCTSVSGHRLEPGAQTEDHLKREVFDCEVFIALLSARSLSSLYVTFEMGARWGSRKALVPMLVAGLTPDVLKPPLSGIHAISAASHPDVHSVLATICNHTGATLEPTAAYFDSVEDLIRVSKAAGESAEQPEASASIVSTRLPNLTANEHLVLWHMARRTKDGLSKWEDAELARLTALDPLRLNAALGTMLDKRLVHRTVSSRAPRTWSLTYPGLSLGDHIFSLDENDCGAAWVAFQQAVGA